MPPRAPWRWLGLVAALVAIACIAPMTPIFGEPDVDVFAAPREAIPAAVAPLGDVAAHDPARNVVATAAAPAGPTGASDLVDVQSLPRGKLVVRVVDARTGAAVPGATVASVIGPWRPWTAAERRQSLRLVGHERSLVFGETATTDAAGRALLRAVRPIDVTAVKDGSFGRTVVDPHNIGADGIEVRVAPAHRLTVRVLDHAGRPCAGVPLRLRAMYSMGERGERHHEAPIGATGDDGTTTIWVEQFLRPGAPPQALEVLVAAPGLGDVRTLVGDRDAVDVQLPAHGSVRVRATDLGGRPLADDPRWFAVLSGQRGANGRRVDWHEFGADGEVTFPTVGLGVELSLSVTCGEATQRVQLAGPLRAGQEVVHEIRVDAAHYAFAGRLLGPDGAPLASTDFTVEVRDVRRNDARTDAEGRFRVVFPRLGNAVAVDAVIAVNPEGRAPMQSAPIALPLAQERDVGDVPLRELPPLVSGTIEQPLPRTPLTLSVSEFDGEDWNLVPRCPAVVRDDTFEVYRSGERRDRRLRLHVWAPGCVPLDPIEFTEGQRLALTLSPGAHLLVRLAVDPAIAWYTDHVEFDLWIADAATANGDAENGELVGCRLVGHEWVYESFSYRPGIYRISIEPGNESVDLGSIDDVRVGLGEPDLRVRPWDLRDAMQLLTVKTFTPDGRALRVPGQAYRRREADGQWESCASIDNGLGHCLVPKAPTDLFVDLGEHGIALRKGVMGALDLTIEPPKATILRIEGMPRLVPGAPIAVLVVPAEGWAAARSLPVGASPIGKVEWNREKNVTTVLATGAVDATVRIVRLGDDDVELVAMPVALPANGGEVRVGLPPAALAALAAWVVPK